MIWKHDDWVRRKYFHRCWFKKGGGSSTTVQSYQPTAEEKRLWTQQADYVDAVAPNALALNTQAMNLLKDSLGTVQVDYNTMNKNAQNQINGAMGNMAALAESNNASTTAANNTLNNVSNQTGTLAGNTSAAFGNLAGQYTGAADKANATLGQLANGNLPSAYQQNMENSIQSALNNTIGKTISGLGNRGVLNSSVTSSALNDIEKNAADTVARQYQQNIGQSANLTQQQMGNATGAADSLGSLIGKQYEAVNNALGQQGQYAQQQFENTQNSNSQNSGLYSNLINSATAPITTAATAQDAAITPAQSLWQTSLGLNGAGTSALGVMGGKGTTTSTQSISGGGGGGFFSGLLGGVANGYANALGGTLFCFPAGTQISMADGSTKDIKHIHEGDMVMSDDGSEAEVVEVMKPHYNDVYNIVCENGHTSTTLTQPLMKPDGEYIFAADLKIGTELKRVGKVKSIIYSGERKVYDFKTSDNNNYIADGFVAMGGDGSIWGR